LYSKRQQAGAGFLVQAEAATRRSAASPLLPANHDELRALLTELNVPLMLL
jgi:hypothetical protein